MEAEGGAMGLEETDFEEQMQGSAVEGWMPGAQAGERGVGGAGEVEAGAEERTVERRRGMAMELEIEGRGGGGEMECFADPGAGGAEVELQRGEESGERTGGGGLEEKGAGCVRGAGCMLGAGGWAGCVGEGHWVSEDAVPWLTNVRSAAG